MTTDLSIYFSPVSTNETTFLGGQIGLNTPVYTDGTDFPDWEDADVVLIGVNEERGATINKGCAAGPDKVREQLYRLYMAIPPTMVDLGNIQSGETLADTHFALQSCIDVLIKRNVTVVVLGGSHDLTLPIYKGYENTEQLVNLTTIDHKFDIGEESTEEVGQGNYLNNILLHQPNFLFNYSNLSYQTYFVSPDVLGLMDKLFFDKIRLGELRRDIKVAEPVLRNSDIVSIDVAAIQAADMRGCERSTPNGLLPDEVCQLTRYAGLSEKVSTFGVFEYNPALDVNGNSALLVSQMLYYFLEGVAQRKNERPNANDESYLKYRVPVTGAEEAVVFYKSLRTDRWWMMVPYPDVKSNRFKRLNMVPCSYDDYLEAGKDELPDLWVKTFRKFL